MLLQCMKTRLLGMAAYKGRGLYPINHTVVVRDDLLAEGKPDVALQVFNAFTESKIFTLRR